MKYKVRILSAKIQNIKNVKEGSIKIEDYLDSIEGNYGNIIGIYGQNGSGKTAFVDACYLLKKLVSGTILKPKNENNEFVGKDYSKYITKDEKELTLEYSFFVETEFQYVVNYQVSLIRDEVTFRLANERIKYQKVNKDYSLGRLTTVFDVDIYSDSNLQGISNERIKILKEYNEDTQYILKSARETSYELAQSFVFSEKLIELFSNVDEGELKEVYKFLLVLKNYAISDLLIIDKKDIGVINIDAFLPLKFKRSHKESEKKTIHSVETIGIDTKKPFSQIPRIGYDVVVDVFKQVNTVLPTIVPGLTIEVNKIADNLINDSGENSVMVQLLSVRNGKKIDLDYESEGIKKIISMLSYLVAMFNSETVCLVVDEFDSDIFEYLIGELLAVIAKRCEGQMIFTSHNLRPLEKLDKKCILFTTTNENNRYIHIKNIKNTQNLRDSYYRAIQLGGQEEKLYDETKDYEIKDALRLAGKV